MYPSWTSTRSSRPMVQECVWSLGWSSYCRRMCTPGTPHPPSPPSPLTHILTTSLTRDINFSHIHRRIMLQHSDKRRIKLYQNSEQYIHQRNPPPPKFKLNQVDCHECQYQNGTHRVFVRRKTHVCTLYGVYNPSRSTSLKTSKQSALFCEDTDLTTLVAFQYVLNSYCQNDIGFKSYKY